MEPLTGTEASPEDLKKALEWELSLDNSDLRSHAWYHGTIPRQRAEELMSEEGDFLIRDCISRPGDYVLTCKWKTTSLHFVINKVVFQPFTVYERIQYQFEDDCFDIVPDLVTYYVGNKVPISAASGAIVSRPVNRSMPLSYYATRYGLECQMHYAALALERVAVGQESGSPIKVGSSENIACMERRLSQPSDVPPKLNEEIHLSGAATLPRLSGSSDYPRGTAPNFSTLRSCSVQHGVSYAHSNKTHVVKVGTNPITSPTLERKVTESRRSSGSLNDQSGCISTGADGEKNEDNPPPKPSRVPSKRYGAVGILSGDSIPTGKKNLSTGSDNIGATHLYSELNYPDKPDTTRQTTNDSPNCTLNSNQSKYQTERSETFPTDENGDSNINFTKEMTIPELDPPSSFDLLNFNTLLFPSENKPLDPPALARMRCMLLEGGPRIIASHLTKTDLDILSLSGQCDLGLGVVTGFELLLLPQGQQLRLDLLERTECLKFFVAITVLTCGDEDVRAQVLNKWIQIAIETKTALGNLYGFTGIMQGLALSQISRLRSTWLKLRQTCTENAFTYETKLRPTLKNMQECSNPQAPNTCIPYLLSLIVILQRHLEITIGKEESLLIEDEQNTSIENTSTLSKEKGKVLNLGLTWEQTCADYGLQLLLTHLEIGRVVTHQWQTYRRNSEIVLENAKYDDLMLDMFRTEFQLKFLWGSKGSHVTQKERYSKFLQVLNVMSERCEAS